MSDLNDLIFTIRGERVILDFHLAKLYGVSTRELRQSVKRNIDRFPSDFMFTLSRKDLQDLMSQIVTLNLKTLNRGTPMAFTEPGVAMLSSVLRSKKAIEINILIVRVFILMRKALNSSNNFDLKITAIENELADHAYQLRNIYELLNNLTKEDNSQDLIGFKTD